MKFDVLHNFISPVTGRVLADFNYVLVGNRQGIAIPSPILIDIRLDLIALRKRYNTLVETDFIVGHPNDQIPNAQVLVNLPNGFLYNTDGIVSTLPTTPQIPLCYAATTEDLIAIYDNGTEGVGATLTGFLPSEFMIDDQTPPINSIILVKDQSPSYENGIYTLTTIGDIITSWVLTRISTYDQPMEIQSGDLVAVEFGTVNAQTLWIQTETVMTVGVDSILFIPFSLFNTLPENNIWIGNNLNKPIPHPTIFLSNLPDLTFEYIWRGDISNRPIEVNDLTVLEGTVEIIEEEIAVIEEELTTLTAQVAANTADIILINGELVFLEAAVAGLVAAVATNTANIIILFNRTLDQVPLAVADVNINNHKLINLSDPSNPLDAVNLQTLQTYIGGVGTVTLVSGTAGQVVVVNGTTTPIVSIDPTYLGQTSITTLGTITTGAWNGSVVDLIHGGSNAALTASNGGIAYSTASAIAILSGTSIANQVLLSGSNTSPTWSSAIYPLSTTINQLLYSSSTNTIVGLATANNAVLLTNGLGIPAWQMLASSVVTSITGTANQITASASTGSVTLSMPTSVVITTSVTAGNLELITNTLQSNNTNGNIIITPNGSGNIIILTGGATGNIGVGTTTPTQARVVINGGVQNVPNEESALRVISALNNVKIELQSTAASGKLYEVRSTNTGSFDITDRNEVATRFIIDTNGNIGLGITPSYSCDVGGTARAQRLIGNVNIPTIVLGAAGVVGTGATSTIVGSEIGGVFTLNTGTGVLGAGTVATFTLTSGMPSSTFSVVFFAATTAISTAIYVAAISSTVFVLSVNATLGLLGLSASTTYQWNYQIVGY